MIKEHDRVVLKKEVPDQGLKTGDVGTVIHVHRKGQTFEVEFLTLQGETVAIATLEASQVRPVKKGKSLTLAYSAPRNRVWVRPSQTDGKNGTGRKYLRVA